MSLHWWYALEITTVLKIKENLKNAYLNKYWHNMNKFCINILLSYFKFLDLSDVVPT